ncbi:hypothetical protein [Cereibacter sphaeroides]|uniref:hypothetical protein n=1 Tax=Cereibacter sphaeroides TaxID=1063 RepID=UPI0011C34E61|nr:hypothetical protein [Cereibacter sphaeroides]
MAESIAGFPYYYAMPLEDMFPRRAELSPAEWHDRYEQAKSSLVQFVGCRDPYVLLAKTALRQLIEARQKNTDTFKKIELHQLELLQAIAVAVGTNNRSVPATPRAFQRLWADIALLSEASLARQDFSHEAPEQAFFRKRVQSQTAYYRFHYDQDACVELMSEFLASLDAETNVQHDFLKKYQALVALTSIIEQRLNEFRVRIRDLMSALTKEEVLQSADAFATMYPAARMARQHCAAKELSLDDLKWSVFQIAELAYPWIFTVPRTYLTEKLGPIAPQTIEKLSFQLSDVDEASIDHFVLSNPIWKKPYLVMPSGDFFCALPQGPYSFPFLIVEELIARDQKLLKKYAEVKANYLEKKIAEVIGKSAPSASVFFGVVWDDPETGVRYENDVLAVVGNFLFMFEAKSGKINPGARRGAEKSLKNDLQALFIDPANQAQRLQHHLNANHSTLNLREKASGRKIDLDLTRPKLVYRFSICFEHFARLTSTRHNFLEIGLIDEDTPWAPVLSIGELMMVSKHLDSEVSFVHYLTRRFAIEKQIDFEGDEQDLLSLFLANGFCVTDEAAGDRRITFVDADDLARETKVQAENRQTATVYGVQLPPLWKATVSEIYRTKATPNTFDFISTILNQSPPGLFGLQKSIKRWRSGGGGAGKPVQYIKFKVADRTFILMIVLRRLREFDPQAWHQEAKMLAMEAGNEEPALTDCVVFAYLKPSNNFTHDAASFFRFSTRGVGRAI